MRQANKQKGRYLLPTAVKPSPLSTVPFIYIVYFKSSIETANGLKLVPWSK